MPGTVRLIFGLIRCARDRSPQIIESHDGPDVNFSSCTYCLSRVEVAGLWRSHGLGVRITSQIEF